MLWLTGPAGEILNAWHGGEGLQGRMAGRPGMSPSSLGCQDAAPFWGSCSGLAVVPTA